jgi:Gpi18-like mannosyltransferase
MQKDLIKKKSRIREYCLLLSLFVLAFILRIFCYKMQNYDYTNYLHPWYDFIRTHDGFAALKYNFANYNVVYLYLLALATYTRIPPLIAIKTLSVLFDPVLAVFAYLILRLKYKRSSMPMIGALVVLFTPTVFLNSAAWGQCDAIYTAFCLGSLYFLLSKHPTWACIFFGLAFSFKLQAIFFLPVILVFLLKGKLSIKYLILIPVIYLVLLVPAFFAGRDAWSLLTIYVGQVNEPVPLTAANFSQWFPPTATFQIWKWTEVIQAIMIVGLISCLPLMSRKQITSDIILRFTLVFALMLPFFLPDMLDRYFYLADVVSIIYAFSFPRYWYVPVIEQICSLIAYGPTLFQRQLGNLSYVACAVFILIVITLADLVKTLYSNIYISAAMPVVFRKEGPLFRRRLDG